MSTTLPNSRGTSLFNVLSFTCRTGPDYVKNKKKAPSGPALTSLLCCDLFETNSPIFNIKANVAIPEIPNKGT